LRNDHAALPNEHAELPLRLDHAVEHLHDDGSAFPMEMAAQARDRMIPALRGGAAAWEAPFICPIDGVRVRVTGTLDLAGAVAPSDGPALETVEWPGADRRTIAIYAAPDVDPVGLGRLVRRAAAASRTVTSLLEAIDAAATARDLEAGFVDRATHRDPLAPTLVVSFRARSRRPPPASATAGRRPKPAHRNAGARRGQRSPSVRTTR
jgi:hypothetical protein